MSASKLIAAAFAVARRKYPDLNKSWIQTSFRLGGLLAASRLSVNVQHDGELDLVLRCMEDERAAGGAEQDALFEFNYQMMLSEMWVASVYETLRLLRERKLLAETDEIAALAEDFRLLRVPLEKHEIANQGQLKAPLQFQKVPSKGDATDVYVYNKTKIDPKSAHIMPGGISSRGSCMWLTVDIKNGQERWIERRSLSDRIIAFWGVTTEAAAAAV